MSKLSFRARALDPTKPMPIYLAEELPDLPEYSAINRAVPQMPSGMEKEEESEHHLQRAICTGLIIPTPEVLETDETFYDRNYPADYKMTRQMIHMQPLGLEQDIPDYDMDTADEAWVNSQTRRLELDPLKFEQMMDRLEKSSGQTVVTLNEAKALLKQDDEISIAVYDYWLNKRLKTQHPLLLTVRTENRAGTAANNPYLAFRRRTEKMQTRKNRKNDEQSYEKMLKLRRDLSRAVTLLEMIKRREKTKREQMRLNIEIFEKRYQTKDFNGQLFNEYTSTAVKTTRPAFAPIYPNQYSHTASSSATTATTQWSANHHQFPSNQFHSVTNSGAPGSVGVVPAGSAPLGASLKRDVDATGNISNSRKEKRIYKKRKHKTQQRDKPYPSPGPAIESGAYLASSDEDEPLSTGIGMSVGTSAVGGATSSIGGNNVEQESPEEEGLYQFRRSKTTQYHKPLTNEVGNWPWASTDEHGSADPKYRFTLTSIRHERPRCIGFARRRMGRGGRIALDRISTTMDDLWSSLDFKIFDSEKSQTQHAETNQPEDSIVGDAVPSAIKVEHDVAAVDSVVVDLVTPMNSRKYSVDSVARTRAPVAGVGENIVIKSEQNTVLNIKQESMDDWASGAATSVPSTPTSVSQHRFSAIAGRATSFSAALRRTVSQSGAHPSNTRNCSRNLISNADITSSFNFTKSFTGSASIEPSAVGPLEACSQPTDDSKPLSYDECARKDDELFGDFLSEIRRDWLHFRPKTPPPRTEDDDDLYNFGEPPVEYSDRTQLQVEIQCLGAEPPSSMLTDDIHDANSFLLLNDRDNVFLTNPFTLDELMDTQDDTKLDGNAHYGTLVSDISLSPGNDINVSGDSLPELSLSLGENEANDKMLENILEECQFDDLKSFNANPNFWNGILEEASTLCEDLDDASLKKSVFDKIGAEATAPSRSSRHRSQAHKTQGVGCSTFSISNIPKDEFFKKEEPKSPCHEEPNPTDEAVVEIKQEIIEEISTPTPITVNISSSTPRTGVPCPPLVGVTIPPIQVVQQILNHSPAVNKAVIKLEPAEDILDNMKFVKTQFLPTVVKTEIVHSSQLPQIVNVQTGGNIVIQHQQNQQGIQLQLMQQKPQQIVHQHQQPHQLHTVVQPPQIGGQPKTFVIQQPHQTIQLQQNNQTLGEGTLLVSTNPSNIRRQNNGPAEKSSITQLLSRASLINRKFHIQQRHAPAPLVETNAKSDDSKPKLVSDTNNTTTTTYIKMERFPTTGEFIVSNANNVVIDNSSAAAVAANHNYSLGPNHQQAQPITIIGQTPPHKYLINTQGGQSSGSSNIALTTPMHQHELQKKQTGANVKVNLVSSLTNVIQQQQPGTIHHQLKQVNNLNQQQQQQLQQQQQSQQNRKTVNMMYDAEKNRILYTNFKNNRGQIYAAVNAPKIVNILPMQNKNNVATGSTSLQGIVTSVQGTGLNKNSTVQRIATIANAQTISQLRQQQLIQQQQQQHQLGIVSGGISVVNSATQPANNSNANISSDAMSKIIQNNDGNAISSININTTNR